jgi:hypothetical protein
MGFHGPAGAEKAPIEAYPCGSDWFDQLSNGTSREWGGVPQAAVDGSSRFFAESSLPEGPQEVRAKLDCAARFCRRELTPPKAPMVRAVAFVFWWGRCYFSLLHKRQK